MVIPANATDKFRIPASADEALRRAFRTTGERLKVETTPYGYQIAEGNVPDHALYLKFGLNETVGADLETVWQGSTLYSYLTSASVVKISSSDVNDDVGGTGALTVQIYGLDANYAEQNETITLDGQTAVNTSKSYLRIHRMIVLSAGGTGSNEGVIYAGTGTITAGVPANKYALISAGNNQTLMALWTVPSGKTAYMTSLFTSSAIANKTVLICLFIRPFGEVFQVKQVFNTIASVTLREFIFPLKVLEKSDIEIRASTSGGGGSVSAAFDLWYE